MVKFGRPRKRKAAAAVEFAIILPLLVLLQLSAIEMSRAIMAQHALQEAAQSACRVYSIEGTSQQYVDDMIDDMMATHEITGYTVTFDPPTKAGIDQFMEPVRVQITVPSANISWLGQTFTAGINISGTATLPADLGDVNSDDGMYNIIDDDHEGDGFIRDDDDPPPGDND